MMTMTVDLQVAHYPCTSHVHGAVAVSKRHRKKEESRGNTEGKRKKKQGAAVSVAEEQEQQKKMKKEEAANSSRIKLVRLFEVEKVKGEGNKQQQRQRKSITSQLVNWCFEPSQPLGIISGLKETFIKRYKVQRTNKADKRPEEQSQKTESRREN